jgi:glycine cleavage system aminomethyltransferase T
LKTSTHQPLISFGPRVRKSPYFDATRRYGVKAFTIYNHTFMPTSYTDPLSEYWSLVNDVTLWDVACQRQVEISGPDAIKLIQLLTPRNMSKCSVGQCQYLLLTDHDGGIINDAVMLRVEENLFWLSPGDGDVLLWVKAVAIYNGMDVKVYEPDVSPVQLQGPKSPHVMRDLFGESILNLKYYWMIETELQGIPLVVSRTGWSGEFGYELYLRDRKFGDQLWETIMLAGQPYRIVPSPPNTIRSVEGGLLSYASDITRADNAYILGIDWLVDLDQPDDFIGKSALAEVEADGPERLLVGVELHGNPLEAPNSEFWPVHTGDTKVGHITRCVFSPRLKKNIGFANVPVVSVEIGSELTIKSPDGDRKATVCEYPWFPAQKKMREEFWETAHT